MEKMRIRIKRIHHRCCKIPGRHAVPVTDDVHRAIIRIMPPEYVRHLIQIRMFVCGTQILALLLDRRLIQRLLPVSLDYFAKRDPHARRASKWRGISYINWQCGSQLADEGIALSIDDQDGSLVRVYCVDQ